MGTRHLTIVKLEGEYKIAQYGQWDGYPDGQGKTILEFLKKWDKASFTEKVRALSFFTEQELNALQEKIEADGLAGQWQKQFPHLSRDMGAEILKYVQDADSGLKLKSTIGFAGDSLMCEFAYVLDLDKNKLEVYNGFNKTPLAKEDRFFDTSKLEKSEGYYPVRLAASYSLDKLPTVAKMTKDCDPNED